MGKRKTNKSGFRIFEAELYQHRKEFFTRFISEYPKAVEELKELIPLCKFIFGEVREIPDKAYEFDSICLLPSDQLLQEFHLQVYPVRFHRLKNSLPSYIALPTKHVNKRNETFYRNKFESLLIWQIAELRFETGNKALYEYLKKLEKLIREMKQDLKENLNDPFDEQELIHIDVQITHHVYNYIREKIENKNISHNDYINRPLKKYWEFYDKFHNWLEKYYLQKDWLRRSFFFTLITGAKTMCSPRTAQNDCRSRLRNWRFFPRCL